MTTTPPATVPLFPLGQTVTTRGALSAFQDTFGIMAGLVIADLLRRHQHGDDGDLEPSDKAANRRALKDGERIFSAYNVTPLPVSFHHGEPDGTELTNEPGEGDAFRVWIITEWDRSSTCVLLPEEY